MDWEEIGKLLSILVVGLGGGVGGKWLLDMYREWSKTRRADATTRSTVTRRERAEAIAELNEIIDILRTDLGKVDAKAEQALKNERECERKWIRAVEYIQYVMFEANGHGWNLRPFKEHGTDTHRPLSLEHERRVADDRGWIGPERRRVPPKRRGGPPDGDQGDQGRVDPHGPTGNANAEASPPLPPGTEGNGEDEDDG